MSSDGIPVGGGVTSSFGGRVSSSFGVGGGVFLITGLVGVRVGFGGGVSSSFGVGGGVSSFGFGGGVSSSSFGVGGGVSSSFGGRVGGRDLSTLFGAGVYIGVCTGTLVTGIRLGGGVLTG